MKIVWKPRKIFPNKFQTLTIAFHLKTPKVS